MININIRVPEHFKETWEKAAKEAGMNLSHWIRLALNAAATHGIEEAPAVKTTPQSSQPPVIQGKSSRIDEQKPMCSYCIRKGPPNTYCSECGHSARLPSKWMQ